MESFSIKFIAEIIIKLTWRNEGDFKMRIHKFIFLNDLLKNKSITKLFLSKKFI